MNTDLIVNATRKAATLLIRDYNELKHFKQSSKSTQGFINKSKARTIEILTTELYKYFPEHQIIGNQEEKPSQESCILIDPLDGETNMVNNLPFWATSVLISTKKTDLHKTLVINFPCLDTVLCVKSTAWIEKYPDTSKQKLKPSQNGELIMIDNLDQNIMETLIASNSNIANIRSFGSKAYSTLVFAKGNAQSYFMKNNNFFYNEAMTMITDIFGYSKNEHEEFNLYHTYNPQRQKILSLKISA